MAKLILAAGMPRAGSGWHYNLVHDLVVAAGGADARQVRKRWLLAPILTEVNCNIGTLSPQRLLPVMLPVALGTTYTVKTHSGPSGLARRLLASRRMRATYIYRDPRAALLSAMEYGARARTAGRDSAFAGLVDFEAALDFMLGYVRIWERWMGVEGIHSVRYEDLLENYAEEAERLARFLRADTSKEQVAAVIEDYRPEAATQEVKGLHFRHGEAKRWRRAFEGDELERLNKVFDPYLEAMGYKA